MFLEYAKAVGIGIAILVCLFLMATQGFSVGSSIWLSEWSDDEANYEKETHNETA